MPKEMSSIRIKRLNSIMEKLCSKPEVGGAELRGLKGNSSSRTFQRDLQYLREDRSALLRATVSENALGSVAWNLS